MLPLTARRYYFNEDNGESTFTRPRESANASAAYDDLENDTTEDEELTLPDSSSALQFDLSC